MAALATKDFSDTGAYPVLDALAATSNTAAVGTGHDHVLLLENTNAAARTVSIAVAGNTSYGEPNPDKSYNLAANTGRLAIPLRKAYADPDVSGRATFTVTDIAGVSAAVVRLS